MRNYLIFDDRILDCLNLLRFYVSFLFGKQMTFNKHNSVIINLILAVTNTQSESLDRACFECCTSTTKLRSIQSAATKLRSHFRTEKKIVFPVYVCDSAILPTIHVNEAFKMIEISYFFVAFK